MACLLLLSLAVPSCTIIHIIHPSRGKGEGGGLTSTMTHHHSLTHSIHSYHSHHSFLSVTIDHKHKTQNSRGLNCLHTHTHIRSLSRSLSNRQEMVHNIRTDMNIWHDNQAHITHTLKNFPLSDDLIFFYFCRSAMYKVLVHTYTSTHTHTHRMRIRESARKRTTTKKEMHTSSSKTYSRSIGMPMYPPICTHTFVNYFDFQPIRPLSLPLGNCIALVFEWVQLQPRQPQTPIPLSLSLWLLMSVPSSDSSEPSRLLALSVYLPAPLRSFFFFLTSHSVIKKVLSILTC